MDSSIWSEFFLHFETRRCLELAFYLPHSAYFVSIYKAPTPSNLISLKTFQIKF